MNKLVLIPILFAVIMFTGCSEEDAVTPSTEDAPRPQFADITLSALSATQTPYEHIFQGSSSNGRMLNTPGDIRTLMDKIEEIFPEASYIDDIETEEKRGIEVWEVEIELPDDEELEFYISKELFEVVEIEGEEIDGTPAYEIDPGDNFITLSQAVATAYSSLESQPEIEEWELSFDDGTWLYKFEIEEEDDIEVYINAETGEFIGIYDDDEDNDDDDEDDYYDDGDDD